MADRYTYVPMIGLFIIIAWGVPDLLADAMPRQDRLRELLLVVLGTAALAGLALCAHHQVSFWRNDITLWNRAIAVTSKNAVAHYNLGTTLVVQGDTDGAVKQFRETVRIDPNKCDARNNLGAMLILQGKIDEAVEQFRECVRRQPDIADFEDNLARALVQAGKIDEAIYHFKKSLEIDPKDSDVRRQLEDARAISCRS